VLLGFNVGESMSLSFDYTSTDAEFQGGGVQVQDVPESLFKASWSYRPMEGRLDFNVTALNVGDIYDTVSSIGTVQHGDYTVVDLAAGFYFDRDKHHRIGARLENALDEDYATSVARATRDVGGFYPARNLGMPRTLHATYSYAF